MRYSCHAWSNRQTVRRKYHGKGERRECNADNLGRFGFVQFERDVDAKVAYDEMHGFRFGPDGDKLSIEVRVDSLFSSFISCHVISCVHFFLPFNLKSYKLTASS